MLKKLFSEPLFHFLVLGALLFLFYSFYSKNEEDNNRIVISKERIMQLTSQKEKEFLRLLSTEEKQELIDKEVYLTVLYKEALKIGLDKSDVDIKGHLAKKMEFVTYDRYEFPSPSDEVLKKFMVENAKDYKEEEKIHFTQNMMGSDTTLFEKAYTLTAFEVSTIFGRDFSQALFTLQSDGKIHKLESTYGVHEVQVTQKSIAQLKDFDTIKEKLQDDYLRVQRDQKNKVAYEALKSQYSIQIKEK